MWRSRGARPEAVRELYGPEYEMNLTDVPVGIGVVRGLDAAEEAMRPYYEASEDFQR